MCKYRRCLYFPAQFKESKNLENDGWRGEEIRKGEMWKQREIEVKDESSSRERELKVREKQS